ncbi:integrase core domain-containing protein [Alkalihalobacillus deserti]|uniref:integrase core domain-containing protein n=1 Tax=Alkalihalobacillus deserti TaxID=2879466 RepID=UPI001D15AFF8
MSAKATSFLGVRVSNDNPYSETMFRTMKYRPEFPYKGFQDLPVAREWTNKFIHWYNCEHQHSGLKFVTREQVHTGGYIDVLKNSEIVYAQVK